MLHRLGFLGFGEASFHIAKGLKAEGVAHISAFDINSNTPNLGDKIRSRAAEIGVDLLASNSVLAESADIIIAAVTADQAIPAAEQTAPHLTASHLYADLNSISPKAKIGIGEIAIARGARFVEIAVMGPVPPYGHKVPTLIGGDGALEFERIFKPLGMRMEIVSSDQVGQAAAVKMFRSVVYKGMEALLLECVLGASRYGAEPRVFASLSESIPGVDWKKLADYMIGRVAVHGERRAREMDEVAKTLEESGVEPMMASATAHRFDWAAGLGLSETFHGEFPKSYQEVLDAISSAPPVKGK